MVEQSSLCKCISARPRLFFRRDITFPRRWMTLQRPRTRDGHHQLPKTLINPATLSWNLVLLQTLCERWCIQEGVHSRRMLVALKQGGSIWSGHLTGCLLQTESIAEEFRAWFWESRTTALHWISLLQFEFTSRRIRTKINLVYFILEKF